VYNKLLGGWYVVRGPHQNAVERTLQFQGGSASLFARRLSAQSAPQSSPDSIQKKTRAPEIHRAFGQGGQSLGALKIRHTSKEKAVAERGAVEILARADQDFHGALMPLASGYSWETVHANISHMIAEGFSQAPAVAVSFAAARRSYSSASQWIAAMWLSYPRGLRIKEYYRPNGEPRPIPDGTLGTTIRKVAARTVRKNPIQTNQLHKAARLFESFAGKKPTRVKRVKLEPMQSRACVRGNGLR